MTLSKNIKLLGADTSDAFVRLGGVESFENLLLELPNIIENYPVLPFIKGGNIKKATENALVLADEFKKFSLTPLYIAYREIINDLHAENTVGATELLAKTLPLQDKFTECIKEYM